MAGVTLGPRGPMIGTADNTGSNTGRWTVAFTPAILAFTVPQVEIYKIAVMGAPGSTFSVYVETKQWGSNIYGVQNEWEDVNSNLIVRIGESLYFYWSNLATDGKPPTVTIFLRYDPQLGRLDGVD